MIFAESPVLLCSAHTTVYVVLRVNPSTAAWAFEREYACGTQRFADLGNLACLPHLQQHDGVHCHLLGAVAVPVVRPELSRKVVVPPLVVAVSVVRPELSR